MFPFQTTVSEEIDGLPTISSGYSPPQYDSFIDAAQIKNSPDP